jgi:hypothetical protein
MTLEALQTERDRMYRRLVATDVRIGLHERIVSKENLRLYSEELERRKNTPDAKQLAAVDEVVKELTAATAAHGPMRGNHEGYAVILEELDELWDEVKKRTPDKAKLRAEAKQVAAMAIRFMLDLT